MSAANFADFPSVSLPVLHIGQSITTGPIPVARHLARLAGLGGKGNLQMIAADDISAFVESFYESEYFGRDKK